MVHTVNNINQSRMKKYDLIFIDADETLFDYSRAQKYALAKTFEEFNIKFSDGILSQYSEINSSLWSKLERREIDPIRLRSERFRILFDRFNMDCDELLFSDSYLGWLSNGSFLIEGAEQVCRHLSKRYILSIITNGFKIVQVPRFIQSPLTSYIQHIIISEDAGYSKPDPGIFEYGLDKIGFHEKDRMLIIGDSLSSDIQGGLNFGIDTCWFNNKSIENETGIMPTYEIYSLKELVNIL